jgi:hypothetical protein
MLWERGRRTVSDFSSRTWRSLPANAPGWLGYLNSPPMKPPWRLGIRLIYTAIRAPRFITRYDAAAPTTPSAPR